MSLRSSARVLVLAATAVLTACGGAGTSGAPPVVPALAAPATTAVARAAGTRSVESTIALAGDRFNALPGDRFNAIPGSPTSSATPTPAPNAATCGDRFNAVPGDRFNAVPGLPTGCGSSTTTAHSADNHKEPAGASKKLCVDGGPGDAQCNVSQRTDVPANPNPNPAIVYGWQPKHLQAAYNLPSALRGAGQTVAIVDAYDDPTAEADLAVYRSRMGLPPCTAQNGCFTKLSQDGKSDHFPVADGGWSAEIALDTQMVSAICPLCSIVLVEANSAGFNDLERAVKTATARHPIAVSNSYYAAELGLRGVHPQVFSVPGVAFTAAAGDNGYGATYPADVPNVTAVAGTTLQADTSSRGFTEAVWQGTGSGCSTLMPKPVWQDDRGCVGRTIADVAVVGDPRTGVAFYTTSAPAGVATGWLMGGGTSAGAPIVAAMYALAGTAAGPQHLWANRGALLPIATGSNGTCAIAYLCTATGAYSGPSGNGAPWGVAAL